MTLPDKLLELEGKLHALMQGRMAEINQLAREINEVKKELFSKTQCCRCWPVSIDSKGYCRCCDFNHATQKSEAVDDDPDYFWEKPDDEPFN